MIRVYRSKSLSEVDFSVVIPVSLSFGLSRSLFFKLSNDRYCFGLCCNPFTRSLVLVFSAQPLYFWLVSLFVHHNLANKGCWIHLSSFI